MEKDPREKNPGKNNAREKKRPDIMNLLTIVLLVAVLAVGMSRFVSSRGAGAAGNGGGNTLSQLGLTYYLENYGDTVDPDKIQSVVRNFGCHQEIHIFEDGNLVMRLSYYNGRMYEI